MAQRNRYEVRVLAGRQVGARAGLDTLDGVTIGNGLDNDIVLLDAQADGEPCRVALHASASGGADVVLEVLQGVVELDGQHLLAGDRRPVRLEQTIGIGDARFALCQPDADAAVAQPALGVVAAHAPPAAPRRSGLALAAILVGLGVLGAVLLPELRREHPTTPSIESLTSRLHEAGFPGVDIADIPDGSPTSTPLTLTGRVATRDDLASVRNIIADAGRNATLAVQVDDELAQRIDDVLRVNGVLAEIVITGVGTARIATEIEAAQAAGLESLLTADIPSLSRLSLTNTPPPDIASADILPFDAGKTVEMIVAGDPVYLVTRDETRYFIGSVLPSGHTITRIDDGVVTVARNGKVSRIEF